MSQKTRGNYSNSYSGLIAGCLTACALAGCTVVSYQPPEAERPVAWYGSFLTDRHVEALTVDRLPDGTVRVSVGRSQSQQEGAEAIEAGGGFVGGFVRALGLGG